ncbi:MAG: lipopolysaccharide heptosyltransferase II [Thermodesulfovibrionia bacterium]|nr:lipopolysaccharide heptosyltransferase II [Thermodesulfovibrionia bacterium]
MVKKTEKILIRGANWIGDAIVTVPAIRSIRHAFPEAHISLLTRPWVAEIFKEDPAINEIILYNENFKGLAGRLKLAKILRQKKFDCAILLQNAFDAALIAWLAKIPEIIGYKRDCRSFLLTKAIPVTKDVLEQHQVYYYLKLLESAGIKTARTQPYIYIKDEERQWARNLIGSSLPGHRLPLIGINPGATYGSAKRWLPERFAEVIKRIINEINGRVVIFGSPPEVEIANEIMKSVRSASMDKGLRITDYGQRIVMMSGKTSLRELAALISECDALITNDSGPMHMASALFIPTVAIFGSTNKETTGPFGQGHKIITKGLPCSPCMKRECPEGHLECMTEITADEVFSALKEVPLQGKAVFLDRDGTVIEDRNYLNSFDELVIFPDAKDSMQRLREQGFKLIGITNQSGIARKIVDEDFIIKSNVYLKDKLGIDDFFYCPHHPDEHCPCRKPEPMLALMAKIKHGINLKASYVIGDKESDVLLARKVGATGILLSPDLLSENTSASHIARNLNDAVEWIVERENIPD